MQPRDAFFADALVERQLCAFPFTVRFCALLAAGLGRGDDAAAPIVARDSCVGCAVQASLPAGKASTSAEVKVNCVRPVTERVGLVRAIGPVIHLGGRMATAGGGLVGPDGKLYAHAFTTCVIFDVT